VLGDAEIISAGIDRLQHHSTTINIESGSCWLREERKAGL
jgi:hypothetical protein